MLPLVEDFKTGAQLHDVKYVGDSFSLDTIVKAGLTPSGAMSRLLSIPPS